MEQSIPKIRRIVRLIVLNEFLPVKSTISVLSAKCAFTEIDSSISTIKLRFYYIKQTISEIDCYEMTLIDELVFHWLLLLIVVDKNDELSIILMPFCDFYMIGSLNEFRNHRLDNKIVVLICIKNVILWHNS